MIYYDGGSLPAMWLSVNFKPSHALILYNLDIF